MENKNAIAPLLFLVASMLLLIPISFAYSSSTPPQTGSIMKINVVDKSSGAFVPANLTIAISYQQNGAAKQINSVVPITQANQEVNLVMPPSDFSPVARIRAGAIGYYDSPDELAITSEQYWKAVSGIASGVDDVNAQISQTPPPSRPDVPLPDEVKKAPYLAEKTFTLERKPGYTPGGGGTKPTDGGCCGPGAILLLIIGCASILAPSKRKQF